MIVYNKIDGKIKTIIPDNQKPRTYNNISQNDIGTLILEEYPSDNIRNYFVNDNKLVRYTDEEIKELNKYGKILTEEERLNILIQPTHEEIAKAKTTLEALSLLTEVGLI